MPNMDVRHVRSDVNDAARVSSSPCCDVIRVGRYHIANVYKPPTEHWYNTNLPPVLPHPAVLVGDFNSHHTDWEYQEADLNGESLQKWALNSDYLLLHDAKQRGTFHSARGNVTTRQTCAAPQRQSVAHSLPPLWFLVTSPTVSTDLQLFTSASSFPSSKESNTEDGTSGKLTGLAILSPQNVPFRRFLQPLKSTHPSVSANAVAAHLIQAAKAPHNEKFERQVRMQGRTPLQQMSDKSLPHPFTEEEISTALQKTKPATAPGYDKIHVEFLKNLGPKACTGCPNSSRES